jgi:hypothetical protein
MLGALMPRGLRAKLVRYFLYKCEYGTFEPLEITIGGGLR